jgi:hypothetical protein
VTDLDPTDLLETALRLQTERIQRHIQLMSTLDYSSPPQAQAIRMAGWAASRWTEVVLTLQRAIQMDNNIKGGDAG